MYFVGGANKSSSSSSLNVPRLLFDLFRVVEGVGLDGSIA